MRLVIIVTVLCVLPMLHVSGQSGKKKDSLRREIARLQASRKPEADTMLYKLYLQLGATMQNSKPDSALYYFRTGCAVAQKMNDEIKESEAIRNEGWVWFIRGEYKRSDSVLQVALKKVGLASVNTEKDRTRKAKVKSKIYGNLGAVKASTGSYPEAIHYFTASLELSAQIHDTAALAVTNGNIGLVYSYQGQYNQALDYFFKSLVLDEYLKDSVGMAKHYSNIGIVYEEQKNHTKALEYYNKSLVIHEKNNNYYDLSILYNNIGTTYQALGDFDKSLFYNNKALELSRMLGDKAGEAIVTSNIGLSYSKQGDYESALAYYHRSRSISDSIGDRRNVAAATGLIGAVYLKMGDYVKAEIAIKDAINQAKSMRLTFYLQDFYGNLSEVYMHTKRYEMALDAYKTHIAYRDSVVNDNNKNEAVRKEMQFQFDKQQHQERTRQALLDLAVKQDRNRQQIITMAIGGIAIVLSILAFVVYRNLRASRIKNRTISEQKSQVEHQKNLIEEKSKTLEQKNREILDSITYAKRIQQAILPDDSRWNSRLMNSLVFYQPKDIVAGDFYWLEENEQYLFVAVADCTGHGVPGAMVSVICSNALTKTVLEEQIVSTGAILNRTRELVQSKLSRNNDTISDGMDIALIRIDKRNKSLIQFSAANRPLWIVRSKEDCIVFKGDKQPIGNYYNPQPFSEADIQLEKGDQVWMFTDGFGDQFGGTKGKKYTSKKLAQLLTSLHGIHCEKQYAVLRDELKQWQGSYEQVDDITLVGWSC